MWVEVLVVKRRHIVGVLTNEPVAIPRLYSGDKVKFKRDHIIDIHWQCAHEPAAADDPERVPFQFVHSGCNALMEAQADDPEPPRLTQQLRKPETQSAVHSRILRPGRSIVTCAWHSALYEEGPVVKGGTSGCVAGGCSSLYGLLGGRSRSMGDSGWPSSDKGRQATRALVGGLAGAKGWERVSMCQMASVSLRATSTRATLVPRWRPSRCLVCW